MAKTFVISNKIGHIINDIEDWKNAFIEVAYEKHWKDGCSACELAKYFTTPSIQESKGLTLLLKLLQCISAHDFRLSHGEIEHESKFDTFRGKGRMQDLIVFGEANDVRVAICIEAKVDESFGHNIPVAYKEAEKVIKKNPNSNAKQRIENLCAKYFPHADIKSLTSIKYQLLYYLEGSINEAKKIGGIALMPILVFHTEDYNEKKGENNRKDYENFLHSLHFKSINEGRDIYKIERDGVTVYTCYMEIEQS